MYDHTSCFPPSPVHPHARGEHKKKILSAREVAGSSPRTWGTLITRPPRLPLWRFIPTHVGNIQRQALNQLLMSVHPHARGEHHQSLAREVKLIGSSPRTWGTWFEVAEQLEAHRFIPTHVGNIDRLATIVNGFTVHPHARGEHPYAKAQYNFPVGSSPRTWGTSKFWDEKFMNIRFIPTHVGNM